MTLAARRIGLAFIAAFVVLATLVAGGTPARADVAPPWGSEPDSVGTLTFYGADGSQITGGSVTDSPIAAYVEGSVAPRSGDTKATLYGYLPVQGKDPGHFSGEQLSTSSTYPNAAAPGSLGTATLPLVTGQSGDVSLAQLEAAYPQNGTGDYAGLYELRLATSGAGHGASRTYDSALIQITGNTWQVYTGATVQPTATQTTLAVTPHGTVAHGTSIMLVATVTPSAATGSVKFIDDGVTLATVDLTNGSAQLTTKALPDGTNKLAAFYVPADNTYSASNSAVTTVVIKARSTTTTLAASKKTIRKGQAETLTATEKPAAAGKVEFLDGEKQIGSVKVSGGKAKLVTKKLGVGKHKLTAKFVPNSSQDFSGSTSKPVTVTVKKK